MKYTNRQSAFDSEKYFQLTETGISDGDTHLIYYGDIKRVQLLYKPTKNQPNGYQCDIVSRTGDCFRLVNWRYLGIARFANQSQQYGEFLKAFHQQLIPYPSVECMAGLSKNRYYTELVLVVLLLLVAGTLLSYFSFGIGMFLIGIIAWLRAYPYFKRNQPKMYSPTHVPEELLGKH